jgi:hypothetical protein
VAQDRVQWGFSTVSLEKLETPAHILQLTTIVSHALSASSVVWVVYCLWFVYNDMAHPNESESTWKETAVAWFKAVLRRLHRRADINHENSVSSRSPDRDLNTGPTEYDGSPPCSISAVYWRINTFTSL